MRVLVTGGAGYIGSFVVRALIDRGHEPVVLDNLVRGHREAVPSGIQLAVLSCGDTEAVTALMAAGRVEAVIHLAASSLVGESVEKPGEYWLNNVGQTAGLLQACRLAGVRRFVLSGTAAVYGEPGSTPITEDQPGRPTNPYGATKRAIEEMLGHFQTAAALDWVSLRYFNAAGAAPDGSVGEDHEPESHLIPLVLATASGRGPELTIYGDDYPTPDGTCLRDYVHVLDLAQAHVLALEWMRAHPGWALTANLGGGKATSVKEVIEAATAITGRTAPYSIGPRRAGDPAVLVAAIDRARVELGWFPARSDLKTIVRDAWAWFSTHPRGYRA